MENNTDTMNIEYNNSGKNNSGKNNTDNNHNHNHNIKHNKHSRYATFLAVAFTLMVLLTFFGMQPALARNVSDTVFGDTPREHAGKFVDDWIKTDAKPQVTAYIVGDDVYDEGEERILYVGLRNTGYLSALEAWRDRVPDNDQEEAEMKEEVSIEREGTTAYSITTELRKVKLQDPFEIKSQTSFGGMLRSGYVTNPPLSFGIKVDDDAASGTYQMILAVTYDYLQDVSVQADDDTNANTTYNYYYDMNKTTVNIPLTIVVDAHPEFVVAKSGSVMRLGETAEIEVEIRNAGDELAQRATAHISAVDPFESPIDDFYLGDMAPGESKTARFKVAIDADAIPAVYGINTVVTYEDVNGKTMYSDMLKTTVDVKNAATLSEKLDGIKPILLGVFILFIAVIGLFIALRKKEVNA